MKTAWNRDAVRILHAREAEWRLPAGTMDDLLASTAGLPEAEFILVGIVSVQDPAHWVYWLSHSEDSRLHRAAAILQVALGECRHLAGGTP